MYQPIILAGYVDAPLEDGSLKRVRIHHAYMEEDAGKLTHHDGYSLVDLNRASTNLAEMCLLGLSVPVGLTITTEGCTDYYANNCQLPAGLMDQVKKGYRRV